MKLYYTLHLLPSTPAGKISDFPAAQHKENTVPGDSDRKQKAPGVPGCFPISQFLYKMRKIFLISMIIFLLNQYLVPHSPVCGFRLP